jgi:acyl-CoA thioesterase FadM
VTVSQSTTSAGSPSTATVAYRARFDECGPDAILRASALLRWAQDIAWIHSERLGFGRDWYVERGLAWVVRGLALAIVDPIRMGASVEVTTSVPAFRKVMARRRTEVRAADGTLAAWADTDWVMTDIARGMPTRVPDLFPTLFPLAEQSFEPTRVAPSTIPEVAIRRPITVRPHEVDPMVHANNATYLDWLEEALGDGPAAAVLSVLPRMYRLEYLLQAALGAQLVGVGWGADEGSARYHLLDANGRDFFRAQVSRT